MSAFYFKREKDVYKQSACMYKSNIDTMLERNKKNNEALARSEKARAELEELANTDTSSFNWNYDISNTDVVMRLREN